MPTSVRSGARQRPGAQSMLRTRVRAGPVAGLVMSLLFALILTAIQAGDRYVPSWAPVFGKPAPVTLRVPYGPRIIRDRMTGRADLTYLHARALVPIGTVLNPKAEAHWTAYIYESLHRPPRWPRLAGIYAIFFTLTMALTAYLRKFGQSRLRLLRVQIGVIVSMGLLAIVAKALLLFTALPEFWIPLAAVPLWVSTSFDRRTAFLVTVVLAFIIASLLEFDLVLLCVMLARGMAATLLYFDRKHSRQMLTSGLFAGLSSAALYVAIVITFEGHFDVWADFMRLESSQLLACLGGGLVGGVLAAMVRSPAARLLGNVPRERLLDLSDLEQPLLVRLSHEAPGTYEHSRAMANLAEQAASAIGADALLTRVGAYYHDLGKTAQAKYFVENLSPDERSPHDDLDPEVSADAIMAHVVMGTKILREGGIPEPVVEFAYTHHGTQLVEYFWNKCLQQGNPKELDESHFRYPGMKPQTKETAILMLVDSIEAASRTIDPPERQAFEHMIERVVFTKLKSGQVDESGLEMTDLRIIINRMADTLVNMHHHRIKYQWQAQRAEEFGVPSNAVRDSAPDIEVSRPESMVAPPAPEAGVELTPTLSATELPEVAPVPKPEDEPS
ncbi:MAG: HDIG domain-containing protein [Myxococcales bacterium]|nr:HDIG domain-containing protein [Myxococcales bacterium]MCB9575658.1 HDIG domain-containing protein [Polyangiaceae bacterium]